MGEVVKENSPDGDNDDDLSQKHGGCTARCVCHLSPRLSLFDRLISNPVDPMRAACSAKLFVAAIPLSTQIAVKGLR